VKLDRFFQAKGCPSEDSLRFTLRVLEQLRRSGEWKGLRERDLLLRFFTAAWEIHGQTRVEDPATPETLERDLSDYDQRLFRKNLKRLEPDELSCLTLWTDTTYSVEDLAVLLNLSPEAVQESLDRAAQGMGRPLEELRRTAVAELCRAQLSGRGRN
jgi:DNA-directed RNA polymerase specialized sigma24 family protein